MLKVLQLTNLSGHPPTYGLTLIINPEKLIGKRTRSLYVRKENNKTLYLSQRNKKDICLLLPEAGFQTIKVDGFLFILLVQYAEFSEAVVSIS